METVYVDILVLTNFIADYFLLLLTGFLSHVAVRRWRILAGAAVASLTSLLIFAPELNIFFQLLIKLSASLIIVLTAFGFKCIKRYIRTTLIFYLSSASVAGGALALWALLKPRGLVVRNGAVFYSVSPVLLIITVTASYFLILGVTKLINRRKSHSEEYCMTLELEKRSVNITGIIDSGNMLRDILSGTPVIVCDYEKIKTLLTPSLEKVFSKENFEEGFYSDILESGFKERFRVIPYAAVNDEGIMAALVLDRAVLHEKTGDREIKNIIMAVTHRKIAGGEYDVLINPELVTA